MMSSDSYHSRPIARRAWGLTCTSDLLRRALGGSSNASGRPVYTWCITNFNVPVTFVCLLFSITEGTKFDVFEGTATYFRVYFRYQREGGLDRLCCC